jgi:hypothetical protein
MLIWSGRGWLVAVIAVACFLTSELVSEAVLRDQSYYQTHGWPKLAAFLVAAAIVWVLHAGRIFSESARTLVDKETGEEVTLRPRHSLFFIPVRYWPLVLAALGVVFLFVGKEQ